MTTCLPTPNPDAQAHSHRVMKAITQLIDANGPMSFARYMEYVLYEPSLGYYCAGNTKFGAQGDYITAPELTPLFGQCLARHCASVLKHIREVPTLLELGPGSGKLAYDLMCSLKMLNCQPERYLLLERSAELRARQQLFLKEQLPEDYHRFQWLDRLPEQPINGLILGNEVVDALAVPIFKIEQNTLLEAFVTHHQNRLTWHYDAPTTPRLVESIEALKLPESIDYRSEINLMLNPWMHILARALNQGVLLLIDYGFPEHEYYHPQRYQGTLMCHYQHRAHDNPLILPGIQDITAHVDFTALGRAGEAAGLNVAGYTNQANFLISCGMVECLSEYEIGTRASLRANNEAKQLLLPSEMGELFKVMAFTQSFDQPLLGFS